MKTTSSKINGYVLLINWILDLFLLVGYIVEYLKGGRSLSFLLAFFSIMIVPLAIATFLYKRDSEDDKIKFITLSGYFVLYTFAVFSTTRTMVYVYILPMLSMYLLYFNLQFMRISCMAMVAVNTLRVIWLAGFKGLNSPTLITDYTIQMASVILFSVVYVGTTRISNEINDEKIKSIENEKDKQKNLISEILETSAILIENSRKVHDIVGSLADSSDQVSTAVREISQETLDITGNLQNQIKLSDDVHQSIEKCSEVAGEMGEVSVSTMTKVEEALDIVKGLTDNSSVVNAGSGRVNDTIVDLRNQSGEIKDVIEIIRDISDKTNLLSLNASIEAARAGESGRGFAVVADEISKLADQSRESTETIGSILNEMKRRVDESLSAVNGLTEANSNQNRLIKETETTFRDILLSIGEVKSRSFTVLENVRDIERINKHIVEDVNHIARFSEKTAAVTADTCGITETNRDNALLGREITEKLIETSADMEKYKSVQ